MNEYEVLTLMINLRGSDDAFDLHKNKLWTWQQNFNYNLFDLKISMELW